MLKQLSNLTMAFSLIFSGVVLADESQRCEQGWHHESVWEDSLTSDFVNKAILYVDIVEAVNEKVVHSFKHRLHYGKGVDLSSNDLTAHWIEPSHSKNGKVIYKSETFPRRSHAKWVSYEDGYNL